MAQKKNNGMLEIDVRIEKKMFYRNGWGIYRVELLNTEFSESTVIVGAFDKEFFPGEEYTMYGEKEYNEKYRNEQYKIYNVQNKLNTPNQVRAFMLACTKREKIVDQLMEKYGDDLIDAIADNRVDYSNIKGLGPKIYADLREKVLENLYMKEIIGELAQYDVTPTQMKKIMMKWGSKAVSKIKENPYILCKIRGIGFRKADVIAQKMGVSETSPHRIHSAIYYILEENQKQGHTWMYRSDVISGCSQLLGINPAFIDAEIVNLDDHEIKVINSNRLSLTYTYEAEKTIAEILTRIQSINTKLPIDADAYVTKLKEQYPTLTDEQAQLFYNVVNYNINLLVGYAGTGKSFTVKLLTDMIKNYSILLLAPTGKASKVIESYTGLPASTIHRAIGLYSSDEDDDEMADAQEDCYHDFVIVDETSMGDVWVISKLLKSLRNPNVRILFIGDDFQIPSVGAGNVLHDLIESGVIKVTRLTKVFRQNEGGVLDIATKVRQNIKFIDNKFELNLPMGDPALQYGNDLVIHPVSQEYILDGVLEYYKRALEMGYSPDDIVVLSPMRINKLGTITINKLIQDIVNPAHPSKKQIVYGRDEKTAVIYRVGDRVINTKNNYNALNAFDQDVTVYNGDTGVIKDINQEDGYILIDYGFDVIKTQIKNLNTIAHAYAMTIHKSQGSGYKCVIMLTDKSQKHMLNANLVYTGITRTKERLFWLCQPDVINHAMNKNMPDIRNTFLGEFLKNSNLAESKV